MRYRSVVQTLIMTDENLVRHPTPPSPTTPVPSTLGPITRGETRRERGEEWDMEYEVVGFDTRQGTYTRRQRKEVQNVYLPESEPYKKGRIERYHFGVER